MNELFLFKLFLISNCWIEKMSKLSILLCIFAFTTLYENILGENDRNVFKIALRKQKEFQRNAMNIVQNKTNVVDIVKLRDDRNLVYTATIKLGNPPQELDVQIDTGSSDFWVYGQECCGHSWIECPTECARKNRSLNCPEGCQIKFFSKESSTFQPTKNYFDDSYGSGHCSGPIGKDTLQIGSLSIPNTHFGIVKVADEEMEKDPRSNGLLGLAFIQISGSIPQKVESPLFEAMNQKLLPENIFTVFMRNTQNGENLDAGGVLTIGGIDHENCGEIIGWADVEDDGYWTFQIDSVRFGNFINDSEPVLAFSDTGNSYMQAPEHIVRQIYEYLGVIQATLEIPCNREYEPIIFVIAGQEYKLTKEMLTVKMNATYCRFGMISRDNPFDDHEWIFGDPFIRQYCHIHDMAKKRIGFTELKNK